MRRYAALVIGIAAAVLFVRLGIWQLSRRAERRAHNQILTTRLALPPLVLGAGSRWLSAPDTLRYRRAAAAGRFDFTREMVEIGRSRQGAPGVHLVTPLLLTDSVAVLVDRGWTYSPDGMTVDGTALREPDSAVVEGVLGLASGRFGIRPDTMRLGYPVLPLMLHRTVPSPGMPAPLRAVDLPASSDGPHLSYAIQWFSFAAIAVVGGALLARRDARPRPAAPS
jgi:surfeit locus 1 family protein